MNIIVTRAAALAGAILLSCTPAFAGLGSGTNQPMGPAQPGNQYEPAGAVTTSCVEGFHPTVSWVTPGNGYDCKSKPPTCIAGTTPQGETFNGKVFVYSCVAPMTPPK